MKKTIKLAAVMMMFLFVSSCAGTQVPDTGLNRAKDVIPRNSFVQIKQRFTIKICVGIPQQNKTECRIATATIMGSGLILDKDLFGTNILTAAHVCKTEIPEGITVIKSEIFIFDILQKKYLSFITGLNEKDDLCILRTEHVLPYDRVPLSKQAPQPKDRVYNVAAPDGIASDDMVPIYEGFFIGRRFHEDLGVMFDYYSLFSAGGSSGSMIVNHRGELIGVLVRGHNRYPISLSPTFTLIKDFVERNKSNTSPLTLIKK